MTTDNLLLTPREAERILRISKSKLYELKSQHRIKFVKIGRSLRFRPEDLQDFVAGCAAETDRYVERHNFNGTT